MSLDAMKQALEALIDLTNEMSDQDFVNQGMDAITALRLAIEEAEKQEPILIYVADVTMPDPGYDCVVCGRFLPADEHGVIVHDDVPHPDDMTFDEKEKPQ